MSNHYSSPGRSSSSSTSTYNYPPVSNPIPTSTSTSSPSTSRYDHKKQSTDGFGIGGYQSGRDDDNAMNNNNSSNNNNSRNYNSNYNEEKGFNLVNQSRTNMKAGYKGIGIERRLSHDDGGGGGGGGGGGRGGSQTSDIQYGYNIPFHQMDDPSSKADGSTIYQNESTPNLNPLPHTTTTNTPSKPSKSRQWLGTRSEKLDLNELDEEEKEMLRKGLIDWDLIKSWRFWIRREWIWWYLISIVIATLVILMTLYHKQIVNWLHPVATRMKEIRFGWLIPIAILIIVSQPPLFGAEIVDILCGLVWGLWIGFAIVAVGTFLGELINFYLFRYLLRARAERMEKKNMNYGLLSHVIREGGIVMATIVRFSAIPGHVSTVIFSTCGLSVWIFIVATIISMPKHIIIVYLGTLLGSTANTDKKSRIINDSVLAITFFITLLAAWYIWSKMKKARVPVWRARRAELAAKGMDMSSLPLDPTSVADRPYSTYLHDQGDMELDDARNPILANAEQPSRHSMNDTGYSASYRSGVDDMSVYRYDDDAMTSSSHIALAQPHGRSSFQETDLGERMNQTYDPAPSFPQAQPFLGSNPVRREVSDAATLYSTPTVRSIQNEPTDFPIPQPHSHLETNSSQKPPQYQTQQSTVPRYSLQDPGMAV